MLALPRGGASRQAAAFHAEWERGEENADAVSVWRAPHARQAAASPLLRRGRRSDTELERSLTLIVDASFEGLAEVAFVQGTLGAHEVRDAVFPESTGHLKSV